MRKIKQITLEKVVFDSAGAKGKAVGRIDGKVVFALGVVPGDVVDIRVTKKKKSYYEGIPINFHSYSKERIDAKCTHFGVCGGCKWQNMQYESQLKYKQQEVYNNLTRLGGIEIPKPLNIMGSKEKYFYRNKIEFSFSDSRWLTKEEIDNSENIDNRNGLGFHIPGKWDKILDVKKCFLQNDPSNDIRLETKKVAEENNISFFSPRNKKGLLRTMMLRISSIGEIMLLIQFFEDHKEKRELLLNHLKNKFSEISSLLFVINSKANDSIYDQKIQLFAGRSFIWEEMEGLKFKVSAKSFYQTNSVQAYELYKKIRDFAGLTGEELVYDLYTGTGTIAQFLAKKAKKVVGVEAVEQAIEDAKSNAKENKIYNTVFYAGDMKNIFNSQFIQKNGNPDIIITDPPRDGMHKIVVEQILQIAPKKVVYVSCNSATQARDLQLMKEIYKVTKTQAVDMFPHTHHIENIVLLEKRN